MVLDWAKTSKSVVIGIGIGAAVIGIIIFLIVMFYEPPLKAGEITAVQSTTDTVFYDQHSHDVYRTVTRYHRVRHSHTSSNGKRLPDTYEDEPYSDQVFDHTEYYITRNFNGADFLVTIQAPSEKNHQKMRTATFYITSARYDEVKGLKGQIFIYTPEVGDKRYDFNNTSQEVDRQWYNAFNLPQWMSAHNVANTP